MTTSYNKILNLQDNTIVLQAAVSKSSETIALQTSQQVDFIFLVVFFFVYVVTVHISCITVIAYHTHAANNSDKITKQ